MKLIASALVKAQKEFAPALKDSNNPFFKSKYADLSTCINAVLDALNNNGIALIQKNHDCADGVKVETILLHESGEEYSGGVLHVPTAKNDPQGYGSALTYARRYSLMATCGIAPEDDDGNAAKPAPKPSPLDAPAYDLPTLERMESLKEIAAEIVDFHTKGMFQDAFVVFDNVSDSSERNELWKILQPNSAVRSKLTAINNEIKASKK